MALVVYPTENYDSFVSVADSVTIATKYSVQSEQWIALDDLKKETFLRKATDRILLVVDSLLLAEDECLKKATTMMAIKDLVFNISANVNPNYGAVTKEKVGDIERQYYHGDTNSRIKSLDTNPFPAEVKECLAKYGAEFSSGIQAIFLRS